MKIKKERGKAVVRILSFSPRIRLGGSYRIWIEHLREMKKKYLCISYIGMQFDVISHNFTIKFLC